jgi:hypothetical protein
MQSLCSNRLQSKAGVAVRSAVTRRTVALARPAQRRIQTQAVAFDVQELQNLPKELLYGGAAALGEPSVAAALGCYVHSSSPSNSSLATSECALDNTVLPGHAGPCLWCSCRCTHTCCCGSGLSGQCCICCSSDALTNSSSSAILEHHKIDKQLNLNGFGQHCSA